MYRRSTYQTIINRIREPRHFIQVLMGPRQIGKTTMMQQVLADIAIPSRMFSADAVLSNQQSWIGNCWQQVRLEMRVQGLGEYLLVFDEIQKIQNWSEFVKKEWDADTRNGINIKVVLLGSSRVMLDKGLADSMAGRFEEIRMGHWTYPEMRDAFGVSLEEYMYFGGYPGAQFLYHDETRWKDYIRSSMVETAIQRDIIMQSAINKPALLRQTFELGAAYSGKLLSLTKMLGLLQDAGNTVTLAGYLELLRESCMLTGLQKYSVDMSRKRSSIPKYQVYNNALTSIYYEQSFKDIIKNRDVWGHSFESAIGAHLVNEAFVSHFEVYYWRDGKDEVDYIIKKNQKIAAIEVKSNSESFTHGLSRFVDLFHPVEAVVIGENGISPEEFLSMSPMVLFGG